jgi:hypothetical protein
MPSYFRTYSNSSSIIYQASVGTFTALTTECTTAPTGYFCFNMVLNNELYNTGGSVQIALPDKTLFLKDNSLLGKITVNSWSFAPGSTGLRFKMALRAINMISDQFKIFVGGVETSDTSNIDAASVTTTESKTGAVQFGKWAMINGNGSSITVSGPYQTEFNDRDTRLFYVDVPVFTSLEFSTNVYYVNTEASSAHTLVLTTLPFICWLLTN